MEQTATIKAVFSDGTAEVIMKRPTACGGNCHACGGCSGEQVHQAIALNPIGASPGDKVILQSDTKRIAGIIAVVYLLPVVLLLVGALCGGLLPALAGLVLGFVPALLLNRRISKKPVPLVISAYAP